MLPVLEGDDARFVALIKPQFEAARDEVGDKGVVRDRRTHEKVLADITAFVPTLGWQVAGLDYSPIRGPEGNIEFLMDLLPEGRPTKSDAPYSIDVTISRAYDKFFKSFEGGL